VFKSTLLIFFLITLSWVNPILGQDFGDSVITDPSITSRCEDLLDKRKFKISYKNKILGLLDRNRRLRKRTSFEKQTIIKRLEKNFTDLRRELYLTRQKIFFADEDIVRKGCPGIVL
jgi:hypothetical protein